MKTIKLLIK